MEMFNDLRSDPQIRDYYQFWFYLYPSGQPFWFSAAQMRDDLAQMRQKLDPEGTCPALDQTVLVGHSMGGLVSKLQTVDSGNDFWAVLSEKPFTELSADDELREGLAQTFFFDPNPSVRRVITIGTPHRGSEFANDTTRWLGRKLIRVPTKLMQGKHQLIARNPGYFRPDAPLDVSTSIDSLAPSSPLLPVLLTAHHGPWVKYNNVMGEIPDKGIVKLFSSGRGDGVVTLESAKLDNAESQIVVPADHSMVHRHPQSILEVRRILLQQVSELRSYREGEILQVAIPPRQIEPTPDYFPPADAPLPLQTEAVEMAREPATVTR
jgi:pimeloyl-ACP methyl ester carboxylesterase